ncbi:MAG: hypothetical protein P8I38_13755 [Arenicella sp.]|nr:hypothetical protein [Arenicella sp.]
MNMVKFSSRAVLALFIFFCVSSAYGQAKVVVIPLGCDDAATPTVYAIGDTGPGGGKVFHVTNGGLNGLEAAPVDQATAPWNCDGTDVAGVDNIASAGTPDSNSGAVNTPLVAVACPGTETNAAVLAAVYVWPNGQRDGFLPNKEELDLLYDQKVAGVVGSFASNVYWSSSVHFSLGAWVRGFDDGGQGGGNKNLTLGVRAVRAF